MIELVAAALRSAGLEPTWEDVADTLWLARQIGRHEPLAGLEGTSLREALSNPPSPQIELTMPDSPEAPPTGGEQADTKMPSAASAAALHLPPAPGTPIPPGGLPFRAPTATALPRALALSQALRPLKRRVPSATTVVLDEKATAERAAEEGVWTPVLRPALTRWLDLALIIDQSPSMAIWARTADELRRLLERQGAFRDVRVWLLDTDTADGRAVVYAGTESATSHARPSTPRELVDPGGRRLILILSDCVAPAWSSGAVSAMLSLWGQASPVAVVHVLPQRLWRYTAIETEPAELRAPHPGAPNARLDVTSCLANAERELEAALVAATSANPAAVRDDTTGPFGVDASAVPVPVITLQAGWLAPWASLVAGAGGRQVPGVVTWAKPWVGESLDAAQAAGLEPPPASLPPAERVERFRAVVSATAFELAGYLAAVPLTLPIMRLVQQAMLPGSAQVHLAEVLLGGLLERLTPTSPDVHPDQVEYDFVDGARELLQDTVLGTDTLRVLHVVGNFIGHRAGRTQTFPSLLLASDEASVSNPEERAFAAMTARTLRQFGAPYEELAHRLEEKAAIGVLKRACVLVTSADGLHASGYFVAPDLVATASHLGRGTQPPTYTVRWQGRSLTAALVSLEHRVMVLRLPQTPENAEVLTPASTTAQAQDGDTWTTFGFAGDGEEGERLTGTVLNRQFTLAPTTTLPGLDGAPVIVGGQLVGQVSGITSYTTSSGPTVVEVTPTDEIRRAVDAAILANKEQTAAADASALAPVPQPGRWAPGFQDREEELDRVLHGLTNAGGPHFWLVVAPPSFGKTWFLDRLARLITDESSPWVVRLVDVREQPAAVRGNAEALLASLFGLSASTGIESDTLVRIAQQISRDRRSRLCLLDSAELLSADTPTTLRSYLGQVYDLVQKSGPGDIRLGLVVASRQDYGWLGVAPNPRLFALPLTGFGLPVVQAALRELADEMGRRYSPLQFSEIAALVYRVTEGLPALLVQCLQWIRQQEWHGLERLEGQELFERFATPYINERLLSDDSLFPNGQGVPGEARRVLEQAFRILAPYRFFTLSHLRHHFESDPAFRTAVENLGWSLEDLWTAISGTSLLAQPLSEPWQEIHAAIRRLFFRYYYRSDEERAGAHREARRFVEVWAAGQAGREQVIGLVECLWHEAAALSLSRSADMEAALSMSASKLSWALRPSSFYSVLELREFAAERMRRDEELQEAIGNVGGLFNRLVRIVAAPLEES